MRHAPGSVQRLATRVPFSRFNKIASRLLWGEETITWRGNRVVANAGEVHGYFLYFFGTYAGPEIEALCDACAGASTFVDVGANHGLVSLALARRHPQLEVWAFEPDKPAFGRFQRNLVLNPDLAGRIHPFESAVGDRVGAAAFHRPDAQNPEVGSLLSASTPENTVEVAITTLDAFFAERGRGPDVVKIDVEGAELQVLRGMRRLFAAGAPRTLLIEVHSFMFGDGAPAFQAEVRQVLETAGYGLWRFDEAGELLRSGAGERWPGRCHILCRSGR